MVLVPLFPVPTNFTGLFAVDVASTLSTYWNSTTGSLLSFILVLPVTLSSASSESVAVQVPLVVLGNVTIVAGPSTVNLNATSFAIHFADVVAAGNFTSVNTGSFIPAQKVDIVVFPSSSISSSSTGSSQNMPLTRSASTQSSLDGGQIAGIVIGVIVFCILCVVMCILVRSRGLCRRDIFVNKSKNGRPNEEPQAVVPASSV
jgi:hypothetical protein